MLVEAEGRRERQKAVDESSVVHPLAVVRDGHRASGAKGGQDVVALVVPDDGDAPPAPDGLTTQLREQLSSYKIPRTIFFIDAADVPYLTSQKPDRRSLAARAVALALGDA